MTKVLIFDQDGIPEGTTAVSEKFKPMVIKKNYFLWMFNYLGQTYEYYLKEDNFREEARKRRQK